MRTLSIAEAVIKEQIELWAERRGISPNHPSLRAVIHRALDGYNAGRSVEEVCTDVASWGDSVAC